MINDEYFLAALRLAAGNDPIPGHVSAAARDAFRLRAPQAVTATARRVRHAAPWRAGAGRPRLVRFVAGGLTFDLEVTVGDGLIDVAGQVFPHPGEGSHVDVRTPHLTLTRRSRPRRPVRGHRPASRLAQRGLPPAGSRARPDQVGTRPTVTTRGAGASVHRLPPLHPRPKRHDREARLRASRDP